MLELQQNPVEGLTTSLLRTILTSSNQDTMGRYDLVFYFPKLKFDRELFPEDEDEDDDGANLFEGLDRG